MTMDICVQKNINIENATNFETTQGGVYWEGAKFVFFFVCFCLDLLFVLNIVAQSFAFKKTTRMPKKLQQMHQITKFNFKTYK